MPLCFFVSDLHGRQERYGKLLQRLAAERPAGLFLGGDLLPSGVASFFGEHRTGFVSGFLRPRFEGLLRLLGGDYPRIFLILGNDDRRLEEPALLEGEAAGLWEYVHGRSADFRGRSVYGYAFVPPTPFQLKDWERYDVSRYVDPGCTSPEEGLRTVPLSRREAAGATIAADLRRLAGEARLEEALFLFHAPPYRTRLDRAQLDGKLVDHAPVDVHVGSIAVRRFLEERQPLLALHGHVHESARLTGSWQDRIGRTLCLTAAHDGPELALVRFDPDRPEQATRELV